MGANYHLRAEDVMQVEVATVLDDATVAEAAHLMRREGVRSLIVEPHGEGDPYGIIAFADIISRVIAEGLDPSQTRVFEIMTKPVIAIEPTMPVKYIARLMRQTRAGHLPVIREGKLIGMVSMTDLVIEVIPELD